MYNWIIFMSLVLTKELVNAEPHYSEYEVARMPQYDYESGASSKAPVPRSDVAEEYNEASPAAAAPLANIDYNYEDSSDTRNSRYIKKDIDTDEETWHKPLKNPRRPRPIEHETLEEDTISKVKTNRRNAKYKTQVPNKKIKNYYRKPRKIKYNRRRDEGSIDRTDNIDDNIQDDERNQIENRKTTKGRRRKPRDKIDDRKNENEYEEGANEIHKRIQKVRDESLIGEPPGLVPGPLFANEMMPDYINQNDPAYAMPPQPPRQQIADMGRKQFDYFDMKRLKMPSSIADARLESRARKFRPTRDPTEFRRRFGATRRRRPTEEFLRETVEVPRPESTSSEKFEPKEEHSIYSHTSFSPTTVIKTTQTEHIITETSTSTNVATTPYVSSTTTRPSTPIILPTTILSSITDIQEEPETTPELTAFQLLQKKKAMKELSLAEQSRLSILKKAERKERVKGLITQKPPVLMQVTPQMATVVMVEPPPDKNNPANFAAVLRAREVSDESPERVEYVKSLMRKKLLQGAKNLDDLTKNWDDVVCDYIDTDILMRATSKASASLLDIKMVLMMVLMPYILSLTVI